MKEYSWFFQSTMATTCAQIEAAVSLCPEFETAGSTMKVESLNDGNKSDLWTSAVDNFSSAFYITVLSNQHPAKIEQWWKQAHRSLEHQLSQACV